VFSCGCYKSRLRCCICCNLLFSMFHLFLHTHVASMFIWMLHVFLTYIASVLSWCCICCTMVLSVFFRCFCKCFICLQTYIAGVASRCFKSRMGVASPSSFSVTSLRCLLPLVTAVPLPLLDVVDVRAGASPAWVCETTRETDCRCRHPPVRPDASKACFSYSVGLFLCS
jgi:hypothetical protein